MCWVYFVQAENGLVKIGVSGDPAKRLIAMRIGSPVPLRLLLRVPGSRDEEKAIHAQFAADRDHGEWFRPSLALLEFMALAATWPGATQSGDMTVDPVAVWKSGKAA